MDHIGAMAAEDHDQKEGRRGEMVRGQPTLGFNVLNLESGKKGPQGKHGGCGLGHEDLLEQTRIGCPW
jgi:hypothetical protein